jgi:CRP-like cAMP-binding protein
MMTNMSPVLASYALLRPTVGPPAPTPLTAALLREKLEPHSTPLRLRPRQKITLSARNGDAIYVVKSGCLIHEATWPNGERTILSILYPGDVFHSALATAQTHSKLAATTSSDVLRLNSSDLLKISAHEPALGLAISQCMAEHGAKLALHIAAITSGSGEERIASLLIEMALKLGQQVPAGTTFEMPVSRTDAADYLSLNPDTVSRIMSRMRTKGIIVQANKRHIMVRNWAALTALSPLAESLTAMYRPRETMPAAAVVNNNHIPTSPDRSAMPLSTETL